MFRVFEVFDGEKDHASHQVGADQNPTHRRDSQEVINDTMAPIERPEVTRQNCQNRRHAADDKP